MSCTSPKPNRNNIKSSFCIEAASCQRACRLFATLDNKQIPCQSRSSMLSTHFIFSSPQKISNIIGPILYYTYCRLHYLSGIDLARTAGLEPATAALTVRGSTIELHPNWLRESDSNRRTAAYETAAGATPVNPAFSQTQPRGLCNPARVASFS